ncbi:MAG TPA: TFIIB-type zinc finger domain-containing protein, partial [bacterium]|nr:TFIIB-type zinc finger domain-containing protein [bacterium]
MNQRKCPNCGATLQGGTYYCDYCGTDWTPVQPITPGGGPTMTAPLLRPGEARPGSSAGRTLLFLFLLLFCPPAAIIYLWLGLSWSRKTKIALTVILLLPIMLFLVFGLLNETMYSVHLDTPKFSADRQAVSRKPTLHVAPVDIYQALRKTPALSTEARKQRFFAEYAGKWVTWRAKVHEIYIYDSIASNLKLKPEDTKLYDVTAYFDPLYNDQLKTLAVGDYVTVSGMIWGYYFMSDTTRLADAKIVHIDKAKDIITPPGK